MKNRKKAPAVFGSFGCRVLSPGELGRRLPSSLRGVWEKTVREGAEPGPALADGAARAMGEWAMERGATHYTHWFLPMVGVTAEKHEAFLRGGEPGQALTGFSGSALVQGEPDASAFPSGGLRAVFEARGRTSWDPTSPPFLWERTLYIPTRFGSWGGQCLDKKTPLLRSREALTKQVKALLALLGEDPGGEIRINVGAEQEYFLVDRALFLRRWDLSVCGRTLWGAPPPKGQEPGSHYFGAIPGRVAAYMEALDRALWELGIPAHTEHNEAAPGQHELAPVYSECNRACDQNRLTMELMQKLARERGMECLLHEKPFAGVNGSGKHINWSLSDGAGRALLDPGADEGSRLRFLLLFCAVLGAADEWGYLFRLCTATASNDLRLGGYEAPPAVVSVSPGADLEAYLWYLAEGGMFPEEAEGGAASVPTLPRRLGDTSDRNRTSPLAFSGCKFEFRMPGASASVADSVTVWNTAVADCLAQTVEVLRGAGDVRAAARARVRELCRAHLGCVWGGNGYGEEWKREAEARGLASLPDTAHALPLWTSEKTVALFGRRGVMSREELGARRAVATGEYCRVLRTEGRTMAAMARREILPALSAASARMVRAAAVKEGGAVPAPYERQTARTLAGACAEVWEKTVALEQALQAAERQTQEGERALFLRTEVLPCMEELRRAGDEAEGWVCREDWPFPVYLELLFGINS